MTSQIIAAMNNVGPGDLITSAYANSLIAALRDLDARLATLEAAKPPTTTPVEPPKEFRIDRAIVKFASLAVSSSATIQVTGVGLDPANLKTFTLEGEEFSPRSVKGDDTQIAIALLLADAPATRDIGRRLSGKITLGLVNRDGDEAQADIAINLR